MMNVVCIQGRLVADPELRQTNTGKQVAAFRLACDRGRKDANGQSLTDWLNVTAWDKTAEFVYKYFGKGQMIAVTGRLQSRQYQDKTGANRTAVEIVAREVDFCGPKAAGAPAGGVYAPAGAPGAYAPPAGGSVAEPPRVLPGADPADDFAPIEDEGDLPF